MARYWQKHLQDSRVCRDRADRHRNQTLPIMIIVLLVNSLA
jgi:hypothetical protein